MTVNARRSDPPFASGGAVGDSPGAPSEFEPIAEIPGVRTVGDH